MPHAPPKPTLVSSWIDALQAFARLCNRTNVGGLSAEEAQAAIRRIRRIRRDVQRTPQE